MAKEGIDSFLLDCHTNDNISEIEAEFGVKGFAVIVRLWQKIYSEKGYYCEWIERSPLLFLSNWFGGNSGVTVNLINEIVNRCLENGIFSKQIYEKYSVLTSERIQKQYFDVVKRREAISVIEEYLVVSVDKIRANVNKNSIYVSNNEKNVCINSTSKVKESKENNTCAPEPHDDKSDKEDKLLKDFEIIFDLYPKKIGRTVAFANYKQWVSDKGKDVGGKRYRLTNRQIYLAIKKYIRQQEDAGKDDYQYWKNFDTLMGRQLLDYVEWDGDKK